MVRPLTSSAGFTYLAALLAVVILGIMQGVAYEYVQTVVKREREAELLFRGQQIVAAIARWNNVYNIPSQPKHGPLNDLNDLLKDPTSLSTARYLRRDPAKEYNDPITGKEWEVIRDPGGVKGIIGVRSTSTETPLKQGGFVEAQDLNANDPLDACLIAMYKTFAGSSSGVTTPGVTTSVGATTPEGKAAEGQGRKYSDWRFVYVPTVAATASGATSTTPGQPAVTPSPQTSGS
jgi:type II secretory pathway pseudopilin PulG